MRVIREKTESVTPVWGAAAMATGIVAIGLHLVGADWPSRGLFAIGVTIWAGLAAVFVARLAADRARWNADAITPGALTAIAATDVLGTWLSLFGRQNVAVGALVIAAVLWAVLLPVVVGHLRGAVPGAAYLVCVSTQSLVVLSATLAVALPAQRFKWPAICLFVLGLLLYGLVLAHFDFKQLRTGAGDHWVAGGAIAISALAAAKLTAATHDHDVLRVVTLILVAMALAWYAVLLVCEVRWPRLRFDARRWSTVFPLGMTSVACLFSGTTLKIPAFTTLGKVLLWPAVVVWAVVAIGALRRLRVSDEPG
ncbi:tellurite resistance/C4-dicarboxylate transporter family protein [Actinomadura barringtoniae]|uniref:Tellurite resistance/C4-dicarboxylate transporter family protein n=2 Tax=Actinomadura barringtoniae TaxID=1427535 RepID=A0A939P873_9ACTN|nr:tellurite resistance/C4-dicarboxylate transporter family protein [Actinomadura barringtoniae]